ncbi:unnamed protein product [marine sediment metagenome]|uniref:Uncharacterized protein n=1 Tax=marine sediment metagenome TaxID=412755 RepID=X0TI97_9ZZZZ
MEWENYIEKDDAGIKYVGISNYCMHYKMKLTKVWYSQKAWVEGMYSVWK